MSDKVVLVTNEDLQNFVGLQCFVEESSTTSEQRNLKSGGNIGTTATHCLSTVSFGSSSVGPGSSTSTLAAAADAPRLEPVGNDDHDGDEECPGSTEEFSNQDNEAEYGAGTGRRLTRPPSIHLRYTGTRIPGRGFDGGVGKCIVYKDGIQRELTLQEVIDILTTPDLSKLSTMPPIKPRGGSMYLYRSPDFETRHDLRADGYLWCQQGTKRMPKEDPAVKRFNMYVRTEEPIRNVSKRPKKTFTKYDIRFKKYEYELINGEDSLVLVHYMGDETVWKPFRHMQSTEMDQELAAAVGTATYSTSSLDEDQVSGYLNSDRPSGLQGGVTMESAGTPPSKRALLSRSVIGSAELMDHSTALSTEFDGSARLDTNGSYGSASMRGAESSPIADRLTDVRAKFESIWPTYEYCRNGRMQGFVHSLSALPQLVLIAGNRSLLNVANDLAQLNAVRKTDRFEFYYVSAGPVADGFYLSTLLCRHFLFNVEPIVPVAFMIHERRNTPDHRRLFELIKQKCPDIVWSECVFITDREYGNISSVLPRAVQLYSWHYMEDEVVNWAEANGLATDEANAYLNDVLSLMKSNDMERFRRDLAVKRHQWTPTFSSFFDSCLKVDIMSKGGRWCSEGRGVYDPFCGVVIPSCNYLNELVGDLVAWHEASLEQLVQCLYYFSEYYSREIERGMHNVGAFRLLPQFAHYSRPQRRLRKFPSLEVTDPRQIVSHVRFSA